MAEKRIKLSPTLFYNIVNQAMVERKIIPEGMSLRSIEELYTQTTVTLDCSDGESW
jgi:hypothetical protein